MATTNQDTSHYLPLHFVFSSLTLNALAESRMQDPRAPSPPCHAPVPTLGSGISLAHPSVPSTAGMQARPALIRLALLCPGTGASEGSADSRMVSVCVTPASSAHRGPGWGAEGPGKGAAAGASAVRSSAGSTARGPSSGWECVRSAGLRKRKPHSVLSPSRSAAQVHFLKRDYTWATDQRGRSPAGHLGSDTPSPASVLHISTSLGVPGTKALLLSGRDRRWPPHRGLLRS